MTIRHVVTWKLAAEDAGERQAQAAEVARRLNALDGVVPQLRSIWAGANDVYPDANWDVTLVADFDSVADLEQYQVRREGISLVTRRAACLDELLPVRGLTRPPTPRSRHVPS